MKIGRRSKHLSVKSLFSGPVLRRLNRRERQELAEKSGAVKAPPKPQRPTFGLEAVEPRLLMSVTPLTYTALNDTITFSVAGTAGAPIVKLTDGSGQLATANLTTPGATEIDISRSGIGGGAISADTINIDTSNFALLNTFMGGNELTIKFDGGDQHQGTPLPFVDTMNVNGASTSVTFGLTLQSTSAINSGANITAKDLTLTSAQTASELLSTGLLAMPIRRSS